jgi:hypothetical protein
MRDDPIILLNRISKDPNLPTNYFDDIIFVIDYIHKAQMLIDVQKNTIKRLKWQNQVQD